MIKCQKSQLFKILLNSNTKLLSCFERLLERKKHYELYCIGIDVVIKVLLGKNCSLDDYVSLKLIFQHKIITIFYLYPQK